MDKEVLLIALWCAQELRAACEELKILPSGTPDDIEKSLWLMAVDAGLDLANLGENPVPPPPGHPEPSLSYPTQNPTPTPHPKKDT